ncbi:MAG: hypothetical protein HDS69_06395 [Bacteroidales bacterium]|nr:hypothetical protein [Bacteroidales bacterium]
MNEKTRIGMQEDRDLSDTIRKLKKIMIALGNAKKELKDIENGTPHNKGNLSCRIRKQCFPATDRNNIITGRNKWFSFSR